MITISTVVLSFLKRKGSSSFLTVCMSLFDRLKSSETVRDVGLLETFILYKINDLKRLHNHVHVHALKTKELL